MMNEVTDVGLLTPDEVLQEMRDLLDQGGRVSYVRPPGCSTCRYWLQDDEDGHRPRWGDCFRQGITPSPGFVVIGERDGAARLVTAPTHGCASWES